MILHHLIMRRVKRSRDSALISFMSARKFNKASTIGMALSIILPDMRSTKVISHKDQAGEPYYIMLKSSTNINSNDLTTANGPTKRYTAKTLHPSMTSQRSRIKLPSALEDGIPYRTSKTTPGCAMKPRVASDTTTSVFWIRFTILGIFHSLLLKI